MAGQTRPGPLQHEPDSDCGFWSNVLSDDKYYDPDPEALTFYKLETGIDDENELKQHILAVQREAFSVRVLYYLSYGISKWRIP